MSFIGSSLSGGKGAGFQANSGTILNPTTVQQAGDTYNSSQNALGQQQAFLNALQAQNGLTNQSSVYNQLQGITNGTGPNPAQAQLAQATGANTANQAALMAGQRGSGANAGLIARQAAQQGAANQQNAAGQAATLQAQQSLNALNAQGSLAGQQVANQAAATSGLVGGTQNEQGLILQGIQGQNNANVQMQSNMNTANAGIAQGNQSFQQGLIGGVGQAVGLAQGGDVPAYASGVYLADNDPSAPPANWGASEATPMPQIAGPSQSELSAKPIAAPSIATPTQSTQVSGSKSKAANFLQNQESGPHGGNVKAGAMLGSSIGGGLIGKLLGGPSTAPTTPLPPTPMPNVGGPAGATDIGSSNSDLANAVAYGGVPMKRMDTKKPAKNLKGGGKVPGKAKHKGDTLKNDTVPAMLSPQEIVIPRSIATHPNAPTLAAKFVAATLAKQGLKR